MGIPVKVTSSDGGVEEFLSEFDAMNAIQDKNNELSKICSIYGHGYEMVYVDESAQFRVGILTPKECFVVYDDTLSHDPVFAYTVRKEKTEQSAALGVQHQRLSIST